MPVDKFGRRAIEDEKQVANTGVTMSAISNTFLRRDGANTIIGEIDMTGNKITNVADPVTIQDAAMKNYVDSFSVRKSGDILTGDLLFSTGADEQRIVGCTDLEPGKRFSVLLGNEFNQLYFTKGALLEAAAQVTMETKEKMVS